MRIAEKAWAENPIYYDELDPQGILRDPFGPLWHRAYCLASGRQVKQELKDALDLLGAERMIVGHTRTDAAPNGELGRPLLRHGGGLLMTDVGIGDPGEPGALVLVEKRKIYSVGLFGQRVLLGSLGQRKGRRVSRPS
jgi:hypothetical protein